MWTCGGGLTMSTKSLAKFPLGQIVVTPRAAEVLRAAGQTSDALLARHQAGDWGDVDEHERALNEAGIDQRFNLVSNYLMPQGERLTIVTQADRSYTLIHLGPQRSNDRAGKNG